MTSSAKAVESLGQARGREEAVVDSHLYAVMIVPPAFSDSLSADSQPGAAPMPKLLVITALLLLANCFAAVAAEFPAFASLPSRPELPDPLVMLDGTKISTAADWNAKRKPELKALFQHYMYGHLPAKPKKTVIEQVLFTDTGFLLLLWQCGLWAFR